MTPDYWRREALRWLEDALEDLHVAENLHPSVSLPSHKPYSREDAERCINSARKIVNYMKKSLRS